MPGIYNRDGLSFNQALEAALARRQAYQDREAARRNSNVSAAQDFIKSLGRGVEQSMAESEAEDKSMYETPEYKAARATYILTGDRSGLDAYASRFNAAKEAEKQRTYSAEQAQLGREFSADQSRIGRDFQAAEAEKSREFTRNQNRVQRDFQAAENALNRKTQERTQAFERVEEKAKLLRDLRDANDTVLDTENNPSKYTTLEKAKARNMRDLQFANARNSGLFTDEELDRLSDKAPEKKKDPETPAVASEETPAGASNDTPAGAPEELEDWRLAAPEFARRINEAKSVADVEAVQKDQAKYKKDENNAKEYEKLLADSNTRKRQLTPVDNSKLVAAVKEAFSDNALDIKLATMIKEGKTEETGNVVVGGKSVPVLFRRNGETLHVTDTKGNILR